MNNKITSEEFEKRLAALIIGFLESNPPEITHKVALSWNFDNPHTVIDWIVDNPRTDKGTALLLYWLMSPGYAKEYADRDEVISKNPYYAEQFNALEKLERNYLSGFYQNGEFAFDPYHDHYGLNLVANEEDYKKKREIPNEMKRAITGKKVEMPEEWDDGIPAPLREEFQKLIALLDE